MEPELGSPSPSTPSRLGKYELVSQLGVGGMAQVHLAFHRTPIASKLVVLKQVRPEFANDSDFAAMFADEARIALRLGHRNVIHAYEASSSAEHLYLAMEFLEGKTLSQLLRTVGYEHFSIRLHLWILCEILAGLEYAHDLADYDGTPLNIVHRDVSPSNVFVTRTGQVKLLDFGIAKLTGAVAQTQNGTIKGNVGYASPEQCLGRSVDARTDLYAVGVMLWEALARRRRLSSLSAPAILLGRLQYSELDLDPVKPKFPEALLAIVRKALELDPERRYQSAAAFQRELTACLDALPGPAPNRLVAQQVELHFGPEFARIRQAIEEQMTPHRPPSIRTSAPAILGERPESLPAVTRSSAAEQLPQAVVSRRVRAAWPWSAGGLVLLAAGAWGAWVNASAKRPIAPAAPSRTVPSQVSDRVQADVVTPTAPSKAVLVSDLPLESAHPAATLPTRGRTQRGGSAESTRAPHKLRAPASAPRVLETSSARNVPASSAALPVPSQQAQFVEPGVDLPPFVRASTHSVDERDPYLQ